MPQIELLSPAKNLESGIAAIQSGADAVYIGADRFGARAAAGNSISDIRALVIHAHKFNAKVFVTLNTILFDDELQGAKQLCFDVYEAGADAIIIQDYGLLQLELPPIAIHASTQMHNNSAEKVKFLEDAGFRRVILARELSLKQIMDIRSSTKVELEAFIHGSLCVSYSGRCYLSHAIGGRSANRGECAQPCRNKYNLEDEFGNVLEKNTHLLSLHDLNLSDHIGALMDAGITSFKIEGRLKDIDYVKNVTSYYRALLDKEIATRAGFAKASSGTITTSFTPDPAKSFNRGFTDYFIDERKHSVTSPSSPKSTGKVIGQVTVSGNGWFKANLTEPLINGDGICWTSQTGVLTGSRINVVHADKIVINESIAIRPGTSIMRNYDKAFAELVNRTDACSRTIAIDLILTDNEVGFTLIGMDEDGIKSSVEIETLKTIATNKESSITKTKEQLTKSGQTIFRVNKVDVKTTEPYFIQASVLNGLRRDLLVLAEENRLKRYKITESSIVPTSHKFPKDILTISENISNSKALEFFNQHDLSKHIDAPEIGGIKSNSPSAIPLMTTKTCLKYESGKCPKYQKADPDFPKSLYISSPDGRFELSFNCSECVMTINRIKE